MAALIRSLRCTRPKIKSLLPNRFHFSCVYECAMCVYVCVPSTSLTRPSDQINLSVPFWKKNPQRTTVDLCGQSERLELGDCILFLSPSMQQAGGPFVLVKVMEDRAQTRVLSLLNGTPDTFKRQTKEQLITCKWAKRNQRSAFFNE